MIHCPKCNNYNSTIGSSRFMYDKTLEGTTKRRRRICVSCGHKWTTLEINKSILLKLKDIPEKNMFQVGSLCIRGHKYKNQMRSLRYASSNGCVECAKFRRAAGLGRLN